MRYRVEQKIETLASNAVIKDDRIATFTVDSVTLSHWNFDISRGWASHSWLAEQTVEADDFERAFETFRKGLGRIVPRIALISQTYVDHFFQPLLIVKEESNVGFLRYRAKRSATGLMFVEDHRQALDRLLADTSIPDTFYYYWNDVVNAVGYTPKLLLMCSAIECLTRTGRRKKNWVRIEQILGRELKEELFGTKDDSDNCLRNRLTHGEYLRPEDSKKNYVELIHKKIMAYFNDQILNEPLLELGVVAPQRHFWGNFEGADWFIARKGQGALSLKGVLADFETNGMDHLKDHELLHDDALYSTY
jgi:hypothetical protein